MRYCRTKPNSVLVAQGEADRECIIRQLNSLQSIILTKDSDLIFHTGATDVLISAPQSPLTTGIRLSHADLGSAFSIPVENLPLLAAVSGNDFADNLPLFGVGRSSAFIKENSYSKESGERIPFDVARFLQLAKARHIWFFAVML